MEWRKAKKNGQGTHVVDAILELLKSVEGVELKRSDRRHIHYLRKKVASSHLSPSGKFNACLLPKVGFPSKHWNSPRVRPLSMRLKESRARWSTRFSEGNFSFLEPMTISQCDDREGEDHGRAVGSNMEII